MRGPRAEREEAEQADETTRKYGLEAGLWSVFRSPSSSQSRAEQAKELLKVGSQGCASARSAEGDGGTGAQSCLLLLG